MEKSENRLIYVAYGSNMDLSQMAYRCPGATLLGKAFLDNWRLMFKSSGSGAYATVEKEKGYRVPILLWAIDDFHEQALDRYEGFPYFYYKEYIKFSEFEPVEVKELKNKHIVDAVNNLVERKKMPSKGMVYIMHEENDFNLPSSTYYKVLYDAYVKFGFDLKILEESLRFSAEETYKRVKKGDELLASEGTMKTNMRRVV